MFRSHLLHLTLVCVTPLLFAGKPSKPTRSKTHQAVRVSLELPNEAVKALLGPSGVGKSVLMIDTIRRLPRRVGPGKLIVHVPPGQPLPPKGDLSSVAFHLADGRHGLRGRLTGVRITAQPRADGPSSGAGHSDHVYLYSFATMEVEQVGEDRATRSTFEWLDRRRR